MENLEYQNEVNEVISEAVIIAYKNSPKFEIDKSYILSAADTSEQKINDFIKLTVNSMGDIEDKTLITKAVCASAKNFILSKLTP